MRVTRPFIWAVVLVAASIRHFGRALERGPPAGTVPGGAGAWSDRLPPRPAYTSDEQNNIDIYKTASEATVNITSGVYRQDLFFQVYPAEGTGSGFIINDGRRDPHQ